MEVLSFNHKSLSPKKKRKCLTNVENFGIIHHVRYRDVTKMARGKCVVGSSPTIPTRSPIGVLVQSRTIF